MLAPRLPRLRSLLASLVVACTAAAILPAVGAHTVHASVYPYGSVETFGADWAGGYASWGDLNAYSNGNGTQDRWSTYGYQYECVEFVQRWAGIRFGEQPIWGGDAWALWGDGPNLRVPLTQHVNGGPDAPQFGDIMVFNRTSTNPYGHTGVVAGVGSGYVLLAEQNWASSGLNSVYMDSPTHVPDRYGLPVIGWLRGPSTSTPPPPPVTVTGASVPSVRRAAVVASDGRLWASTGSGGALTSLGNSLSGSPALVAEPPTSSPGNASLVHYLGANADSHQLYTRSDRSTWVLASTSASCLDGPAALSSPAPGGLSVTVACEGTDHAVWVTSATMAQGGDLVLDGPWTSWGGITGSGPALALIGGQPAVVVSGTDQRLWERSATTPWTAITGLSCTGHPAMAASARLTWVACRGAGDGALWYTSGVDGSWAAPRSAGGGVVDGPGLSATPAGATVDVDGTDGTVWEASLSVSAPASSWTGQGWRVAYGPASVALPPLPIAVASAATGGSLQAVTPGSAPVDLAGSLSAAPAVVSVPGPDPAAPTALEVAVFADQSIRVRTASAPWQLLDPNPAVLCLGGPAALVSGTAAAPTLTVACQGLDHALWYATGSVPATGLPTLSGWRSLGGVLSSGPGLALMGGTPTFVAVGGNRQLYWATPSMSWGAIPGWFCNGRPALAAGATTTYLACQGTDHALWWATNAGGGFSSPASAGGVLVDGPGVAAWDNQAIAFVNGSDGTIWQTRIAAGQAASSWAQLTGTSAVGGAAATAR